MWWNNQPVRCWKCGIWRARRTMKQSGGFFNEKHECFDCGRRRWNVVDRERLKTGESPDTSFGCFIATAAYGIEMAKEVRSLCKFRDQVLLKYPAGRNFIKFYYKTSPPIADFIRNKPRLKAMARMWLKPLVISIKEVINPKKGKQSMFMKS